MNKRKLILFASILIIGYTYLPMIFENIPLPGTWFITLSLYALSLIYVKPRLLLSKQVLLIYLLSLIYLIMAPITKDKDWFLLRVVPLFVGITLCTYYFRFSNDIKGQRILFWFALVSISLYCITTSIGLIRYPDASRDLASSVFGDIKMTKYYYQIGIGGYGFISALAYFIPLIIALFRGINIRKWKLLFFVLGLITIYTIINAQYTGQFLIFLLALLLSLLGSSFTKYKVPIILSIITLYIVPSNIYANLISSLAELIPGDILKDRLFDVAETFSKTDINKAYTHTGARYQRIPFLWSEFIKSPIYGGGQSTGHNMWLDHLSLYGLIGIVPWFFLLRDNYYLIKKRLKTTFVYYQIAFLMYIGLGFIKGSGSREQYILLFFILPLGLYLFENGELFKKKKRNPSKLNTLNIVLPNNLQSEQVNEDKLLVREI